MFDYKIVKLGNPSLRQVSELVSEDEFNTKKLSNTVDTLFYALRKEGGVGIAAPQIGINKRIIVFGVERHPVYTQLDFIPDTVLINPTIQILTDELEESYEGCMSLGPLRGKVSRPKRIYYSGFTVSGDFIEKEVDGLCARIVQHEADHLDGIVFLDKVTDQLSLGFHEELVASGQLKLRTQEQTTDNE